MGVHEEKYQFCPVCGLKIEKREQENRESIHFRCNRCGFIRYADPKLVVCAVLEIKGGILLIKRSLPPQKGKWNLPGGYVDRGEELKAAAARETDEECGVKIRVNDLIGIYSYSGNPIVLVAYQADHISGELSINNESLDAGLFKPEELPWEEMGFQSTKDTLKDYLKKKKK